MKNIIKKLAELSTQLDDSGAAYYAERVDDLLEKIAYDLKEYEENHLDVVKE